MSRPKPYKSKKKPKRNRRRRTRSFSLAAAFVCTALVLTATLSAAVIFFKIGHIEVTGETKYTAQQIIDASGLQQGQSMYLFDKFACVSRIFSACPYVEEIRIRRHLPDGIEIQVTPCRPTAVVQGENGSYIIDGAGKILEKISGLGDESLSRVKGGLLQDPVVGAKAEFFDAEQEKALFSILNTAKNNDILSYIGDINIAKVYDIQFEYKERFIVRIGTADDLQHKLKFADAVIETLGERERATIDVSDGQTGYVNQTK